MANVENLKPPRSTMEARTWGKKGGIASGESRREKRSIKERLKILLAMKAEGDFKGDNGEAMCAAMVNKAVSGDVQAFIAIRDSIGEKPVNKLEHSGDVNIAEKIKAARSRVRNRQ